MPSSQAAQCSEISDVIIADRAESSENSEIALSSTGCAGYVQLATYIAKTPSHSEMSNDSAENLTTRQQHHSSAHEVCHIANYGQPTDVLTDSPANCMPLLEDKLDIHNKSGNVSGNDKKRSTRKPVKDFPVKCPYLKCKESFVSCAARNYHLNSYHAIGIKKLFVCHLCKKAFRILYTLKKHFNGVHSHRIRFTCPIASCPKFFYFKNTLQTHVKTLHTDKVAFQCPKCPRKSYSRSNLIQHLAKVHGEVPHLSCHLCGKTFNANQSVQMHLNSVHDGFRCPSETCSSQFSAKSTMMDHINALHTKKTMFQCPKCPHKTYYKQHLKRHLRNTHGDTQIYKCHTCQCTLKTKQAFRHHLLSLHSGRNHFQCPITDGTKTFAERAI